ncbi:MAG: hypothetical protein JNL72_13630 [Flavipsychrobacter sp.]|nr:hypothetical protein [Flavipsychrobacter sp.]
MKSVFTALFLLVSGSLFAQDRLSSTEWESVKYDIDKSWNDYKRPDAFRVCLPETSHPLRRTNLSDHDCIMQAIRSAKTVGNDEALEWIVASQCRNAGAMARIRKAGDKAVKYVVDSWGNQMKDLADD